MQNQSETDHPIMPTHSSAQKNVKPLTIGIVAGEASGDALGAELIKDLNQLHPRINWVGVGGEQMRANGLKTVFPMSRLAVMGIVEVLKHLPDLLKAKEELLTFLDTEKIDIYIGVDAPDFNLRISKILKQKNIHTIQYVSPSVWAWREKRIHKIMNATHQVLCLFPFELPVYKKYQHPAACVGHPLIKQINKPRDMLATRRDLVWQLAPLKERFIEKEITSLVALLPGSRNGEINKIAPILFATAHEMLKKDATLSFLVPAITHAQQNLLNNLLKKQPQTVQSSVIVLYDAQAENFSHQVMSACDIVIAASGTVTLEAMLLEKPMAVVYKLNGLSYKLIKSMIKIPFVALPNIIAGQEIVPEFIQEDANPEKIAACGLSLLNEDVANTQVEKLQATNNKLRKQDIESAAAAVLSGYY